jgi:hypothetical protein
MKDKKLLEVSMMLGDAIKKLDALSAYKPPKTKTLYLWVCKKPNGDWVSSKVFSEYMPQGFFAKHNAKEVKRLDYTALPVDV